MVWLIVLLILLFLLFYPLSVAVDMRYAQEDWMGCAVLYPFFTLPWIKITLWDSHRPKKEKPPKKEKKKKQRKKETDGTAEAEKKQKKSLLQQLKNQPLSETISMVLELLKTAARGTKRLRVRVSFGYALEDPAVMGYLTGAIYAVVPAFLGDPDKTRWRIGIYPQWTETETMGFLKGKVTLCLFDLFYAYGGVLINVIKILMEKIRRK